MGDAGKIAPKLEDDSAKPELDRTSEVKSEFWRLRLLLVAATFPPVTPFRVRVALFTINVPSILQFVKVRLLACTIFEFSSTLSLISKVLSMVTPLSASCQVCMFVVKVWFVT